MLVPVSIDGYIRDPIGRCTILEHVLIGTPHPGLRILTVWECPTFPEAVESVRILASVVLESPRMQRPLLALTDTRALDDSALNSPALRVFGDAIARRSPSLTNAIRRHAIILPPRRRPWVRSAVAGFYTANGVTTPSTTKFVESMDQAMAHLGCPKKQRRQLQNALSVSLFARLRPSRIVNEIRNRLSAGASEKLPKEQRIKSTTIADEFGVSDRTLRDHLGGAGTTYSYQSTLLKVMRAIEIIDEHADDDDFKISMMYKLAGFSSPTRFFSAFKEFTSMTPAQWLRESRH